MASIKNNHFGKVINLDTNIITPLAVLDLLVEQSGDSYQNFDADRLHDASLEFISDSAERKARKQFYVDTYFAIKEKDIYPFVSFTTIAEIVLSDNPNLINFVKKYCITQSVQVDGDKKYLDCADEIEEMAMEFVTKHKVIGKFGDELELKAPMIGRFEKSTYVPSEDARIVAAGVVYGIPTLTNNVIHFIKVNKDDMDNKRRHGILELSIRHGYVNGKNRFGGYYVGLPKSVQEMQESLERIKSKPTYRNNGPYKYDFTIKETLLENFEQAEDLMKKYADELSFPSKHMESVGAELTDDEENDDLEV